MTEQRGSRWEQMRSDALADPAARERYERTRRAVVAARELLRLIDAERERAGLSKAALAQSIGASPSAVRRLFSSDTSNPTLMTLLEMVDALGLELRPRPKRPAPELASDRTRTAAG